MDLDFLDDFVSQTPTPTKSVRFYHHDHPYPHDHKKETQRNTGSTNSLNLLIPQVDVGSPLSPIIGGQRSPRSPRVHQFLHSKNVSGYGSENDVSQASMNDAHEDWNFQSYHLDYKHTPPLVKGPCCVCNEGIIGAMVTALDKMWHPQHFVCANCNLELIGPNYLEHDQKPYCKHCHGILFLPPCFACHKSIEGKYVTVLDGKIAHPECFTCTSCNKILSPTEYLTKDFKPYCEECYHKNFSPKCHSCLKPIKDERRVEVGNRKWHSGCFKCCHCGVKLTPNNFKEKNGKLYCENDYNDLFKPKCAKCNKPILEEPTRAMNKEWHPNCFNCTECHKTLNPNKFMEKGGKPYCEDDYHRLFSPKCTGCTQPIKNKNDMVNANGKSYHTNCFKCCHCGVKLTPTNFKERNGKLYCEHDFNDLFKPKCAKCNTPILEEPTNAMNQQFHPNCLKCTECKKVLDPNRFFVKNGLPYCEEDYYNLFAPKCAGCLAPIKDVADMIHAQNKTWHKNHFTCHHCKKTLDPTNFYEKDGRAYCEEDYYNLFAPKCVCGLPIKSNYVNAMGQKYHPNCFKCHACGKVLQENNFYEKDGRAYCEEDFMNLFAPRCRGCSKPITTDYCVVALGFDYHPNCFRCKDCNTPLEHRDFYEYEGEPYCEPHYHARMCPDCMKLRRAENRYWGLNDSRTIRPSSSMLTITTDIDSGDSRPASAMSQMSSARIYDVKSNEERDWRESRAIPIMTSSTTNNNSNSQHQHQQQMQSYNNASGSSDRHALEEYHDHFHHHENGLPCTGNHYEKKILADATASLANKQRNTSGEQLALRNSGSSTIPYVNLNAMKSNHQHKHEKFFETGTLPGKFPTEGVDNNMRFQTFVTKDEFQTVSRNY